VKRYFVIALVTAVSALAANSAGGAVGRECAGIPTCIDVPGPWIAVPANGESQFLLDCPLRRGIVAGIDARATSRDVHVSFDGLLGSPIAPGRTTTAYAMFRGVSVHHRQGLFQPLLGCVPSSTGGAQTTAYMITPAGPALQLGATVLLLKPGTVRHATLGCPNGESIAYSWDAIAFATANPPAPALAKAVQVHRVVRNGEAAVTIQTSEATTLADKAEVQIGVACGK
jgi:hypothetical protein